MAQIDRVLRIDAELVSVTSLDASLSLDGCVIECGLSSGEGGRLPYYEGEYVVTPKADNETILATKQKSMRDDVKVLKIPTESVSNLYGTTFAIAREGIEIDYGE